MICSPSQRAARREQAAPLKLAVGSPSVTRDAAGIVCVSRLGEGLATGSVSPVCGVGVWWFQVCSKQAANVDFGGGGHLLQDD